MLYSLLFIFIIIYSCVDYIYNMLKKIKKKGKIIRKNKIRSQ